MSASWINASPILACWLKMRRFYDLKIKIYVNFYPLVYRTASKTVCISMTNPHWASTQTFKSKLEFQSENFQFRCLHLLHPVTILRFIWLTHSLIVCGLFNGMVMHFTDNHIMVWMLFILNILGRRKVPVPIKGRIIWFAGILTSPQHRTEKLLLRLHEWDGGLGQRMVAIKTY